MELPKGRLSTPQGSPQRPRKNMRAHRRSRSLVPGKAAQVPLAQLRSCFFSPSKWRETLLYICVPEPVWLSRIGVGSSVEWGGSFQSIYVYIPWESAWRKGGTCQSARALVTFPATEHLYVKMIYLCVRCRNPKHGPSSRQHSETQKGICPPWSAVWVCGHRCQHASFRAGLQRVGCVGSRAKLDPEKT